jgi:hypothetical protein
LPLDRRQISIRLFDKLSKKWQRIITQFHLMLLAEICGDRDLDKLATSRLNTPS